MITTIRTNPLSYLTGQLNDLKAKKQTEINLGAGLRVRRKGGSAQARREEAAVVELTQEGLDQLRSELQHLETEIGEICLVRLADAFYEVLVVVGTQQILPWP